ncbi:unnamed protein product [Darwinula stevensoni]|uniref:Uncharacterized protein n=1 Tax=Darwinula stevensoni TaxID=69355 RepID=A0A7R8ZX58_9CRUS|nr:unnamed protein product [Darwinula stevensoni]CAG0878702.1 unnamed protein product [Darwinula stevensoni]
MVLMKRCCYCCCETKSASICIALLDAIFCLLLLGIGGALYYFSLDERISEYIKLIEEFIKDAVTGSDLQYESVFNILVNETESFLRDEIKGFNIGSIIILAGFSVFLFCDILLLIGAYKVRCLLSPWILFNILKSLSWIGMGILTVVQAKAWVDKFETEIQKHLDNAYDQAVEELSETFTTPDGFTWSVPPFSTPAPFVLDLPQQAVWGVQIAGGVLILFGLIGFYFVLVVISRFQTIGKQRRQRRRAMAQHEAHLNAAFQSGNGYVDNRQAPFPFYGNGQNQGFPRAEGKVQEPFNIAGAVSPYDRQSHRDPSFRNQRMKPGVYPTIDPRPDYD